MMLMLQAQTQARMQAQTQAGMQAQTQAGMQAQPQAQTQVQNTIISLWLENIYRAHTSSYGGVHPGTATILTSNHIMHQINLLRMKSRDSLLILSFLSFTQGLCVLQ